MNNKHWSVLNLQINQDNFLKISHALCKHNIWFFGELSFRKEKVSYYWIIFLCRVIKTKFYWFTTAFLFFSFFFFFKVGSQLFKFSKRKNHLKPENLETLFPLSALKMLIKSVTSHQAEIKYLEVISPLIFRFCHKVWSLFNTHIFKNMMNNYA